MRMFSNIALLAWGLSLSLLLIAGCQSYSNRKDQEEKELIEKTSASGDARMIVRLSPKSPKLSELVELRIEVSYPEGVDIEPPTFGQSVGDFAVREYGERTPTAVSPKVASEPSTRVFRYVLEPMFSGRHLIRTIPIVVTDRRGQEENRTILQSDPIEVDVTSELDPSATDLANVDPMFDPMDGKEKPAIVFWIGLIIALVICAYFLVASRKRSETSVVVPALTPQESARVELEKLLSEELPSKGLVKEFYLRLTGIVRTYIEGSTGLKAPEQTTEEFLVAMRSSALFSSDDSKKLQDFLEAADMVKYAGQQPTLSSIEDSAQKAREFISIPFLGAGQSKPLRSLNEGRSLGVSQEEERA